jgi:hypothetical protein
MADKVTYRFYMGRKAMFDAQLMDGNFRYYWENFQTICRYFQPKNSSPTLGETVHRYTTVTDERFWFIWCR